MRSEEFNCEFGIRITEGGSTALHNSKYYWDDWSVKAIYEFQRDLLIIRFNIVQQHL